MTSRFLSLLILVLAFLTALVLFVYGGTYPTDNTQLPKQKKAQTTIERIQSIPSTILSTFSLLPDFGSKPSFFAVVIENHEDARPYHEGLQEAAMVQEFLVEGFISRFVALFDARRIPKEIGPVRSLRPYFLDSIAPWSRVVLHAGGSPEALNRVTNGSDFFARNLLYFDDEDGSLRHKEAPAPHNLFLNRALLQMFLAEAPESLQITSDWPFYKIGMPEGGDSAVNIAVNFFNPTHNIDFAFQPLSQKYKRTNGSEVSPAMPSTVVILEVPIDEIGAYGRLFMTLEGGGRAQVFHSGKEWDARWSRPDFTTPFRITDSEGNDLPFAKGQIWMMALPTLDRISWE